MLSPYKKSEVYDIFKESLSDMKISRPIIPKDSACAYTELPSEIEDLVCNVIKRAVERKIEKESPEYNTRIDIKVERINYNSGRFAPYYPAYSFSGWEEGSVLVKRQVHTYCSRPLVMYTVRYFFPPNIALVREDTTAGRVKKALLMYNLALQVVLLALTRTESFRFNDEEQVAKLIFAAYNSEMINLITSSNYLEKNALERHLMISQIFVNPASTYNPAVVYAVDDKREVPKYSVPVAIQKTKDNTTYQSASEIFFPLGTDILNFLPLGEDVEEDLVDSVFDSIKGDFRCGNPGRDAMGLNRLTIEPYNTKLSVRKSAQVSYEYDGTHSTIIFEIGADDLVINVFHYPNIIETLSTVCDYFSDNKKQKVISKIVESDRKQMLAPRGSKDEKINFAKDITLHTSLLPTRVETNRSEDLELTIEQTIKKRVPEFDYIRQEPWLLF